MKLWDLDGKPVRKTIAHAKYANGRFNPDGHLLLTWGVAPDGEVAVKLWSVDGELLDAALSNQVVEARIQASYFVDALPVASI